MTSEDEESPAEAELSLTATDDEPIPHQGEAQEAESSEDMEEGAQEDPEESEEEEEFVNEDDDDDGDWEEDDEGDAGEEEEDPSDALRNLNPVRKKHEFGRASQSNRRHRFSDGETSQ